MSAYERDLQLQLLAKKSFVAMFFSGLFFLAAAALICFIGRETAWAFVAASLIAGGFSQFAFQDFSKLSQRVSIITAWISVVFLITALISAVYGY
ncbi:hypothetical protein ABE527_18290 [Brucella sp. TWI432]